MRILGRPLFLALLLSVLVLQAGPAYVKAQTTDYLIVPGKRLGMWELGKPLSTYGFGQPSTHAEQKAGDTPWNDFYTFAVGPGRLNLWAYTCKNDSLVFAILVARVIGQSELTEATKYKTAEGIAIGTDEGELLRVLGQPLNSFDSRQTVSGSEVTFKIYDYAGLRIRVPQTDHKVHALGATTQAGFAGCQQAVVGGPTRTGQVNLQLPVPLPSDLRIAVPYSDVPPDRAGLSGVWVGKWDNVLDTALAVEEVTREGVVRVVYAWGVAPAWNIARAGWTRAQGGFGLGVATPAAPLAYWMRSDGRLDGIFYGRQLLRTPMSRLQSGVQPPVPMPNDLRVVTPSSDVPVDRAALSGVWVGKWDNILDTALAVEEIAASGSIRVVYAWGRASAWNINQPGWTRAAGESGLVVATDLAPVTYRLRPDGRLDAAFLGRQQSGTVVFRTIMTRIYPK